jgi:hypothetical protein
MKKTTEIKRPSVDGLEQAFTVVAFGRLKKLDKPFNNDSIQSEASRIERCVEYMYKIDKKEELDYPQFASKFLKDNVKELISGNKYSGLYLSDVDDDVKERAYYMEDATFIF